MELFKTNFKSLVNHCLKQKGNGAKYHTTTMTLTCFSKQHLIGSQENRGNNRSELHSQTCHCIVTENRCKFTCYVWQVHGSELLVHVKIHYPEGNNPDTEKDTIEGGLSFPNDLSCHLPYIICPPT